MAIAIARTEIIPPQRVGRFIETRTRLALSSTYVTGGFAVSPTQLQLGVINAVSATPSAASTVSAIPQWNAATGKMLLLESAAAGTAPTEMGNGDTANQSIDVVALGTG